MNFKLNIHPCMSTLNDPHATKGFVIYENNMMNMSSSIFSFGVRHFNCQCHQGWGAAYFFCGS